jgi:hypothetical protein
MALLERRRMALPRSARSKEPEQPKEPERSEQRQAAP